MPTQTTKPRPSPGLPHAMHTANGLQLSADAELGLHQQDMRSLHNVEALGARLEGQQQHINTAGGALEGGEMRLQGRPGLHQAVADAILLQALGNVDQHLLPLKESWGGKGFNGVCFI